ncbi:CMRF35-like molecule 1 [Labrus bergylta]|uniref:CMRF35-like molecule 1 n=1 Tax=Labrus bergylta TaxID=56723 RepID=UPI0033137178
MKTIFVFYCLLHATWKVGADITAEGFERGEVSFNCSHRNAWSNNKYLCKNSCKDILVTVKSGRSEGSERIALKDSGNGVLTVTFRWLQLTDSGKYWCAVKRLGFDTYIAVYLTVKRAVVNETTTVKPGLFNTYQTTYNSTQQTSGIDTNISTASNCTTGGEQNSSTGTVLFCTVGGVVMITILVLAVWLRKRRKGSKHQPQVCSNSTGLIGVRRREEDSKHAKIGEGMQSTKILSKSPSFTHKPKQDPPEVELIPAKFSDPFQIYENICCSKGAAHSRHATANLPEEQDSGSRIYINPLPHPISDKAVDGALGKHRNKPTTRTTKPPQGCTSEAAACHSTSLCDSTETRPRSLWFGLDLSGTV